MTFSFVGGDRAVEPDKVLYIESRSHKLSVIMEGERPEMYGKLSDLEKKLSSRGVSGRIRVSSVAKKRYAEVKEKFLQLLMSDELRG